MKGLLAVVKTRLYLYGIDFKPEPVFDEEEVKMGLEVWGPREFIIDLSILNN